MVLYILFLSIILDKNTILKIEKCKQQQQKKKITVSIFTYNEFNTLLN